MKQYIFLLMFVLVLPSSLLATDFGNSMGHDFPDFLGGESDFPDLLDEDQDLGGVENDFGYGEEVLTVYDPFEPVNRVFFEVNDKLYFWVLKPVKTVYSSTLPADIRLCVGNFFANAAAPIRLVNNLLQGEFEDAGIVATRFVINTILGIGGLGDAAYLDFDLEPRGADFGQTLGKWGIGEGVYLFWPGLGPSTLRDSFGMVGDTYFHPAQYIYSDFLEKAAWYSVDKINVLSLSPDIYEELKKISLDPYVASRQAYYEYRRSIIANE